MNAGQLSGAQPRAVIGVDDPLTRDLTATLLGRAGVSVRRTGTAAEAVAGLADHPADLLVLGIDGPGDRAERLCAEARGQSPNMRVVALSSRGASGPPPPGSGLDATLPSPPTTLELTGLLSHWGWCQSASRLAPDTGFAVPSPAAAAGGVPRPSSVGDQGADRYPPGMAAAAGLLPQIGDFSAIPPVALFFAMRRASSTGVVEIAAGEPCSAEICLLEGCVMGLGRGDPTRGLIDRARAHMWLAAEHCDEADSVCERHACRELDALVYADACTQWEGLCLLRRHVEERLLEVGGLKRGGFRFTAESVATTEWTAVEPLASICEGMRASMSLRDVVRPLERLAKRYIVPGRHFDEDIVLLLSPLGGVSIEPLLDGRHTFEQALRYDDRHAHAIACALYALRKAGVLEARDHPVARPTDSAQQPSRTGGKCGAPPADYAAVADACEWIPYELRRLRRADHFARLRLPEHASADAIAAALAECVVQVLPSRLPAGLPPEITAAAREIASLLAEAHDCLRDDRRRALYIQGLNDQRGRGSSTGPQGG